jgi:hypothetical protein
MGITQNVGLSEILTYGMLVLQDLNDNTMSAANPVDAEGNHQGSPQVLIGYYVMPQYQMTLDKFLTSQTNCFEPSLILEIGIKIIDSLWIFH